MLDVVEPVPIGDMHGRHLLVLRQQPGAAIAQLNRGKE
jgi:hypothetical protein